ncbi:MAG: pyrroline-5-carboxylate reductase [Desulfomonilaceae bacterium]|jgi:pyrroline-5-carboxylate reductase
MKTENLTITLIGVGAMGNAIVHGLVRAKVTQARNITVFDIDSGKTATLKSQLGVLVSNSLEDTLKKDCSVVLLAVKPQVIDTVLDCLAKSLHRETLLISIAAGIATKHLLEKVGHDRRVIRAMPNAAAMVGQSATALCKAGAADDRDLETAIRLFDAVGSTVVVDEKNLNAVTGLSGSGPGYLFVIMEAMIDSGVLLGLSRDIASRLTIQTFLGAASMAAEGKPLSELKGMITSPGGTTINGLRVLERAGTRGVLMETVAAAADRADELSKQ